jgi:hypothetical protein
MHAGAERFDPSGWSLGRHTCLIWIPACFISRFLKRWTRLFLASPQAGRAPLPLLPDVVIFILLLIGPSEVSLALPGMIDDFNFLAPIPVRVDSSNSFVDGSAIGSFLPVLNIPVTAFRTVLQRGQL